MVAVPADATVDSLRDVAIQNPYTKLPVYEESLDHVIGVVHLKDVLRAMYGKRAGAKTARDLMRETIFVPETARIGTLLKRFRARQQHLAIVLDEYGGTAGVVTLEDLLEEIVGEVSDPFDAEPEIQAMPDGSSLIDGLTLIDEVNEHFGLHLADSDYDTIAGFVLGKLGRLAQVGDSVEVGRARLRVEAMDGRRIARVSLSPAEHAPEARPAADAQA
jgi:CBS domain containing-hemolysin-like protein